MNRRDFIRRVPLVVAASAVAVEEAKRGWVRRFFPGFGPGTLTRRFRYQNPYGPLTHADLTDIQSELDEIMRRVYGEPPILDALRPSELLDAFYQPASLYTPRTTGGIYLEFSHVL